MAPILHLLPDLGPHQHLIYLVVLVSLVVVIYNVFFRLHYPTNLLRFGRPPGKTGFSWSTRWKFYTDCSTLFREAYEQYNKKGKSVLIPGIGFRDELLLPHSAMRWVFAQPDSALSVTEAFLEMDQVLYGLGHTRYVGDPWQGMLVKTEMNAVLENLCEAMNNELGIAFDTYFGVDVDSWKEIDLFEMVRLVVAQAASRFTVGAPLCRNKEYLEDNLALVDKFVLNAGLTGAAPRPLRPIVGPLVSCLIPSGLRRVRRHFEPLLKERLETLKYDRNDPDHPEPQDHLQMMLRYAQKERQFELADVDMMTKRLVTANFGSMHQTSIQVTNMLLNIMGSDAEYNTISVLRDEVSRIIGGSDESDAGRWTKSKVAKLVRCDSVARETMRLNSFGNRAVMRKVMVDGLVTEDGIKLPKGCIISFLGHPIQSDGEKFEDPLKYDPFRFSRVRESSMDADGKPGATNLSFVSTSPQHLPFGHGKHACPGRFLVDFELKMIIAYVLRHYDVEFPPEYDGKRPPNIWLTEAILPPPGVKIRLKRRKQEV